MNRWIKKAVYRTGYPLLVSYANRGNFCFGLSYHRFENETGADPKPGMAVAPDMFRSHLKYLSEIGSFVSIDQAAYEPAREPRFFVTFDDGYHDNITVLLPILEELNIPCCIFVVTDLAQGKMKALEHDVRAGYCPDILSVVDIEALSKHPLITFGSHTATHRRLSTLSKSEIEAELSESKAWLESVINQKISHCAAPFGQFDDMGWECTLPALVKTGYRSIVSNYGGVNSGRHSDRFTYSDGNLIHLRRVAMPQSLDKDIVRSWVLGGYNIRERFSPRSIPVKI